MAYHTYFEHGHGTIPLQDAPVRGLRHASNRDNRVTDYPRWIGPVPSTRSAVLYAILGTSSLVRRKRETHVAPPPARHPDLLHQRRAVRPGPGTKGPSRRPSSAAIDRRVSDLSDPKPLTRHFFPAEPLGEDWGWVGEKR